MSPGPSREAPIRNIVLILADQHRADCLGCYGNPIVRTPNIDALAGRGVRFTHAFTPSAICTPARASIQTGLAPRNHGLLFNWEFQHCRGGLRNLPPEVRFFSQGLCEAGWNCAHVGKWHIGDVHRPADYGYEGIHYPGYGYPADHEHYLSYLREVGVSGFELSREVRVGLCRSAMQAGPQEASVPGYLAHQTIEFIERFAAADRPFFISCNFWGPHTPFLLPRKHFEMYDDAVDAIEPWPNFDCPLDDKPAVLRRQGRLWGSDGLTPRTLAEQIAKCYGCISLIDEEAGRILAALEAAGELDRTLVVYTSDHGSMLGSYRMWDKGYGMYDATWRVPMIVSSPSLSGRTSDAFVSLLDLAPTFLAAAGCERREGSDGVSLLPLLTGKCDAVREDHILCEGYGHQIPFWQRMVRTRTAKYIYNPTDRDEFYDLAVDPHETRNVIDSVGPAELKRLRALLREQIHRTGDPVRGWSRAHL